MNSKLVPYIFLALLLLTATLIIGVQIGKRVEEKNKKIAYELSLTPSARPASPVPTQPLAFKTYQHKGCGIEFVVPNQLMAEDESSEEATIINGDKEAIALNCKRLKPPLDMPNEPVATSEVKIANQNVIGTITDSMVTFTVRNPLNSKIITVKIAQDLLSLFERTVKFNN